MACGIHKTFTFLIIFSLYLLQAAGHAFPTMILQRHDGVFPNVTNSTNTSSVDAASGTFVISVNAPREVDQIVANQVKRYKDAVSLVDDHEILPGNGKEKRVHHKCHLTCSPANLVSLCKGSPVLAGCTNDCTLYTKGPFPLTGGNGVAPLGGNDTDSDANVTADEEHVACVSGCSCTHGNDKRAFDDESNVDNAFEGLD
ncbi:hypothetical protein N8I77_007062 [Diaporthe amygdali]|uniref:Uncharacterized protein n=1 Tax=Phomopsis amygdali TaxID=1214568 RepID=A0AAD9W3Q0_PHOAM|nr:hypothetical protein N8I77_007062 [Diaporthe amygdali]